MKKTEFHVKTPKLLIRAKAIRIMPDGTLKVFAADNRKAEPVTLHASQVRVTEEVIDSDPLFEAAKIHQPKTK